MSVAVGFDFKADFSKNLAEMNAAEESVPVKGSPPFELRSRLSGCDAALGRASRHDARQPPPVRAYQPTLVRAESTP